MLAVVEICIFDTFCWVWIAGGPMAGGSTHLLPLHLHQTTLEVGAVAIAAAIEGQQRRHALMPELQHTRHPWQLQRLALRQCHLLRHPLLPHQLCQHGRSRVLGRNASLRPTFCQLDGEDGIVDESVSELGFSFINEKKIKFDKISKLTFSPFGENHPY